MKKLISLLLLVALAVSLALPALADSTPAIYRVTDSEGHTIWVMGTFHLLDAESFPLAGVEEILDGCDVLALETVASEEEQTEMSTAVFEYTGNSLPQETLDRIAEYFASVGLANMEAVLPLLSGRSLFLLLEIYIAVGGNGDAVISAENWVTEQAGLRGLRVIGLESATNQSQAMADTLAVVTEENANEQILAALDAADEMAASIIAAREAWSRGDAEALARLAQFETAESAEEEAMVDSVITERNDVFFDGAVSLLQSGGRALVAVGYAHVMNPDNGLLVQLEAAGYTVERWYPEETEK